MCFPKAKVIISWMLLVLLPLGMAWWLFWFQTDLHMSSDTKTISDPEDCPVDCPGNEAVLWKIKRNENSGAKKIIKDIFQVPFDLTYYQLILENKTYRSELEPLYLPVAINFYSSEDILLEDDTISLGNANFLFNLEIEGLGIRHTPSLKFDYFVYNIKPKEPFTAINVLPISAKPLSSVQFASSVIFFLAWWVICFLVVKILLLLFPSLSKYT